jgi:hypothetical protein
MSRSLFSSPIVLLGLFLETYDFVLTVRNLNAGAVLGVLVTAHQIQTIATVVSGATKGHLGENLASHEARGSHRSGCEEKS